jgi:hypothetical protein
MTDADTGNDPLWTFECQDSQVASVRVLPGSVVIHFSAACVQRREASALAGALAGEAGYLLALDWVFTGVTDLRQDPACMGRVAEGGLRVQGGPWLRRGPVPWQVEGGVALALTWANGETLALHAQRAALHATAATATTGWLPSLAC